MDTSMVLVAILGPLVGGAIAYIINRQQLFARDYEQERQIKFQTRELERSARVAARTASLSTLSETLARWVGASRDSGVALARWVSAQEKQPPNTEEIKAEERNFWETAEESKRITAEFEIVRHRIGDDTLDEQIDRLSKEMEQANLFRQRLVRFLNDPGDASTDELFEAKEELEKIDRAVRGAALIVNRRIEDLLTGASYK